MSEHVSVFPVISERLSQDAAAFEERIRHQRAFLSPRFACGEQLLDLERTIVTSGGLARPEFYQQREKALRLVTSKIQDLFARRHPEAARMLVWFVEPFMSQPNAMRLLEQATGYNASAFRRSPGGDPAFDLFLSHLTTKGRDAFRDDGAQSFIIELVRAHVARLHEATKRLQVLKPQLIKETQERFEMLRGRGLVSLTPEFIWRRLEMVRVYVADPLENEFDRFGGGYDADTHDIYLDPRHSQIFQRAVYGHEALRALQGRSEVDTTSDDGEPETTLTREGLTFYTVSDPVQPRFRWLSEAVVDRLAEHVFDQGREHRSGARFIEVLGRAGVAEELLFAAYFEQDRSPVAQGKEGPNPDVRRVFQQASRVLGPRAFVEIDSLVTLAHEAGERESVVLNGVSEVLESRPGQLMAYIRDEKTLLTAAAQMPRGDA